LRSCLYAGWYRRLRERFSFATLPVPHRQYHRHRQHQTAEQDAYQQRAEHDHTERCIEAQHSKVDGHGGRVQCAKGSAAGQEYDSE
jgi:hypothetical protein